LSKYSKILNLEIKAELARRQFKQFVKFTFEGYKFSWFHVKLCNILQDFYTDPDFKKLMIFMPPQHGKSELASRRFPAWILGKNPSLKIGSVSYSHSLATKFNKSVQRIIDSPEYSSIFPETKINTKGGKNDALRNSDMFEIVDNSGSYMSVGIGGSLTGNKIDLLIIDDPVKDHKEAESITTQKNIFDWYNSVASTRLNNKAKQLIILTRWNEKDLAGLLLEHERQDWHVFSLPAIKEDPPSDLDPRDIGHALWEEEHSKEKILKIKARSEKVFLSLYQQTPASPKELQIMGHAKYTDTIPEEYAQSVIYGLDFGFTGSELALVEIHIDQRNKRAWAKTLLYEHGLTNLKLANWIKENLDPSKLFYCDGAEPKSIQELRDYGVNSVGVKKFAGSVKTMIQYTENFENYYTCNTLGYERQKWLWKAGIDGKPTGIEIDKYNHAWKAYIYALWGFFRQNTETPTKKAVLSRSRKKLL